MENANNDSHPKREMKFDFHNERRISSLVETNSVLANGVVCLKVLSASALMRSQWSYQRLPPLAMWLVFAYWIYQHIGQLLSSTCRTSG